MIDFNYICTILYYTKFPYSCLQPFLLDIDGLELPTSFGGVRLFSVKIKFKKKWNPLEALIEN